MDDATLDCPCGHFLILCQHCGVVIAECACGDAGRQLRTHGECAGCRRRIASGELSRKSRMSL